MARPAFGDEPAEMRQNSTGSIVIDHRIRYRIGTDILDLPERQDKGDTSSEALFGEVRYAIDATLTQNWQAYADMRVFAATSSVSETTDDDLESGRTESTSDADSFAQLRRLWLRYRGLTDYPGEHLTLGLQRLRAHSSMLWDSYMESLVWRFDTTRFKFQTGIGERFDTYRTNTELSDPEKDKPRAFAELSYDWRAYHFVTLSAMYAEQDGVDFAEVAEEGAPEGINGEWIWYGIGLSSNWRERRSSSNYAYTLQYLGLEGSGDFLAEEERVFRDHDISAWAVDAGIRYDCSTIPASFGFSYIQGSGGFDASESNMYVQTGLQSNREPFVGNALYMYRLNEALRPDLTNLRSYAVFASQTIAERFLLGAAVAKIERVDEDVPVYRFGDPLAVENGSKDVGWGVDLGFRHLLDTKLFVLPIAYYGVRGSTFFPGDAFSDAADSVDYRFVFEIVGEF